MIGRAKVGTVALAVVVALPVTAAATHKPGHGGGTGALTLAAAPNPVVFGKATVLSGRLANDLGGRTIQLEADVAPFEGDFANLGTATTSATGDYSFTHRPVESTAYRARQGNTVSAPITVLVRIRTSLRLSDATPRQGRRVRFSGRACPEHDGAEVSIQRRARGSWRTVRRTTLRDLPGTTCSTYAKRFRVRGDGTYRTLVAGDANHAPGVSGSRRIDVHG